MACFLAERAENKGPARARGRLFNLGRYPGMLEAETMDDWVQGDLYSLPEDGGATLKDLDRYENGESPHPAFFERTLADVLPASGSLCQAWIYWFRGPVQPASHLPSGDWLRTSFST